MEFVKIVLSVGEEVKKDKNPSIFAVDLDIVAQSKIFI
jgi:hypothetical protein